MRVTAQLIQVSTDMHLWADAYEREVSQILDLQRVAGDRHRPADQCLRQAARSRPGREAGGVRPVPERTVCLLTNTRARGWQQAIEHFNEAIENDPDFAPAYAGLADTYLVAGAYGAIPTEEALTRGKAAAVKALRAG